MKDDGKNKKRYARWLPPVALALILTFSFLMRGAAYFLPAFSPEEQASMRDEAGEPYLTEMDSYFYLRKAYEMADAGHVIQNNNRAEDPLIGQKHADSRDGGLTPLGLSATAYLLWRYFFSVFGVSLTQVAIWMDPVFGSLSAIPAFLYVKRRAGLTGAAVAGLLTACALPFFIHTHAGFFDTDMVLAPLPLLYLLCQMRCMQEEKLSRQILYAFCSAAAMTAMSFFWVGFTAYFLLALISAVFTAVIILVLPMGSLAEKPWRRKGKMLRGGLISLGLVPLLLFLTGGARAAATVLTVLDLFRSATGNTSAAMPGAYRFTGEMMAIAKIGVRSPLLLIKAGTHSLMAMLGGAIPCALAAIAVLLALGMAVYLLKHAGTEKRAGTVDQVFALCVDVGFLVPWLLLSLKLAFSSVRYAKIAVLPVCILCGLAVGWMDSARKRTPAAAGKWLRIGSLAVSIAAVLPVCIGAWQAACTTRSQVTDAKAQAMAFIREELPEDTAVASWWDDGYYTEFAAQRRTLADGGTSSGRMNWLMGRALLTDDPQLSIHILRMLNLFGTDVLDDLTNQGLEEADAANLLLRLLACGRDEAEKIAQDAKLDLRLLDKTHPRDDGGIALVLSTDLIGKAKALNYYAFWNPSAGRAEQSARILPSKESAVLNENHEADLAMGQSGIVLHLSEDPQGRVSAFFSNSRGERYEIGRICVWQDGRKLQDDVNDPDPRFAGLVLVKEGGRYCGVLCNQIICDSILLRMLLCEDGKVENFRLLGTWYGETGKEPCQAQRRVDYLARTAWAVQVWQAE